MSSPDFFDGMKRSFADVPVDAAKDNGISTSEFLEASESLVELFSTCILEGVTSEWLLILCVDVLSVAFKPVQTDMLGNVKVRITLHSRRSTLTASVRFQKIRDRQLAKPAESETLQALVSNELKEKGPKNAIASDGLLWLSRFEIFSVAQTV